MGRGRLGAQARGEKKERGKKQPTSGYGVSPTPVDKIKSKLAAKRRASQSDSEARARGYGTGRYQGD